MNEKSAWFGIDEDSKWPGILGSRTVCAKRSNMKYTHYASTKCLNAFWCFQTWLAGKFPILFDDGPDKACIDIMYRGFHGISQPCLITRGVTVDAAEFSCSTCVLSW